MIAFPRFSDLVCYWFEKARAMIEQAKPNVLDCWRHKPFAAARIVKCLKRIKESGDIFWAQSIVNGFLMVQPCMSRWLALIMVAKKQSRLDDRVSLYKINADLIMQRLMSPQHKRLTENFRYCFHGHDKSWPI